MKTEIRERWTAELRSGKYEQGKNFLATTDGKYCCLGVLCELAVEDGVISKQPWATGPDGVTVVGFGPQSEARILPVAVQRWAGLFRSSPHVPLEAVTDNPKAGLAVSQASAGGFHHVNLASLNDTGVPFSDIADLIDANFPEPETAEVAP